MFHARGKALPQSATPPEMARRIHANLDWCESIDPHAYVGIVDNLELNVVADRHQFGEFVALYIGALVQLIRFHPLQRKERSPPIEVR